MTREFRAPDKGRRLVSGLVNFLPRSSLLSLSPRATSSTTCHSILRHTWPLLLLPPSTSHCTTSPGYSHRESFHRHLSSPLFCSPKLIWNSLAISTKVHSTISQFFYQLLVELFLFEIFNNVFRSISRNSCEQNYHDSRLSPLFVGERRLIGIPLLAGLFHRSHGRWKRDGIERRKRID